MDDVPFDGKRVIVRIDMNVPVGDDNKVDDLEDYRLEAALPTIQELQQKRCKVLLLSHRGRPGKDGPISSPEFDLAPVKARLEDMLKDSIVTIPKLVGPEVESIISGMEQGSIACFPNVRIDEREKSGNIRFGKELASVADAYVNDAFSVSHRAHTSMAVLPTLLPSAAGRRVVAEVMALQKIREHPDHPYVAIVSGAKIRTKVNTLRRLLEVADKLCIGGALANVFLVAQGHWQTHIYDTEEIETAKSIMDIGQGKLMLPVDVVVGDARATWTKRVRVEEIPADADGLWDIGPDSVQQILNLCSRAKTIMWNGPVGMFEVDAYVGATRALAMGLSEMTSYRVVGGGDTVNALERFRLANLFTHVSVGGGAMISYIEGKQMPGLDPLYAKD